MREFGLVTLTGHELTMDILINQSLNHRRINLVPNNNNPSYKLQKSSCNFSKFTEYWFNGTWK